LLPFIDLKTQAAQIQSEVALAIQGVLEHGQFVMGPEVKKLEEKLSQYVGVRHCITCGSGTDALQIGLMANETGKKHVVFTTPFTFIACAEVITLVGAVPVFVDVDPKTFNLNAESLKKAIEAVKQRDASIYPIPKVLTEGEDETYELGAIIAVDLFGMPADYDAINNIADENSIAVIEDGAQSFGASANGVRAGQLAKLAVTSFFPAKPLGAYGDGGAIFTNDDILAQKCFSIRNHGQDNEKYCHQRQGINSRLDTMQAAVLLTKLSIFDQELQKKQHVAKQYNSLLANTKEAQVPFIPNNNISAWSQYSVLFETEQQRDNVQKSLSKKQIPSVIYYPVPLHQQKVFEPLGYKPGDFPITEKLSKTILSLPMHPYMTASMIKSVCEQVQLGIDRSKGVLLQA